MTTHPISPLCWCPAGRNGREPASRRRRIGAGRCPLSLYDNLEPWELIEQRLDAAASAGFVIALYNPVSRARPGQFGSAIERLRGHLPASTPVVFGRAATRPSEHISVVTLDRADT